MKQFMIAIGLVGALTAAIVGYVMYDSGKDSGRQTAEAAVVGFAATPVTWFDGEEDQEGHTLTYAWVDGANQVHTETQTEVSWYDPDHTYKVCYNPSDPADRKLYPADHVCGS
jgi:hypothetical protein